MSVHAGQRLFALALLTAVGGAPADDVIVFGGTGAPSGGALANGQTLGAAQSALYVRKGGSNVNELLYATSDGGTTWAALELGAVAHTDPGNGGAIPVTSSGVCALTSTGAGETRTLAIPSYVGQRLTLIHDTDGGNINVTASQGVNKAGHTTIPFGDAGDFIELVAATVGGALRWRVVATDGVTTSA